MTRPISPHRSSGRNNNRARSLRPCVFRPMALPVDDAEDDNDFGVSTSLIDGVGEDVGQGRYRLLIGSGDTTSAARGEGLQRLSGFFDALQDRVGFKPSFPRDVGDDILQIVQGIA